MSVLNALSSEFINLAKHMTNQLGPSTHFCELFKVEVDLWTQSPQDWARGVLLHGAVREGASDLWSKGNASRQLCTAFSHIW